MEAMHECHNFVNFNILIVTLLQQPPWHRSKGRSLVSPSPPSFCSPVCFEVLISTHRLHASQHACIAGETCGLEDSVVTPPEVNVHQQWFQLLCDHP